MYVTPQDLKAQVRDLRADISAVAKDLSGDIQYLNQRIDELKNIIEFQAEAIKKLNEIR